jgi:hypothetical protein
MLDFTWTGAGAGASNLISGSASVVVEIGVVEIGEFAVAEDCFSVDDGVPGLRADNLLVEFGRAAEFPAKEDDAKDGDDAGRGAGSADAVGAASWLALMECEVEVALALANF